MSAVARKVAEQLALIDARNPALNAYLRTYPEAARDAAEASDRRHAEGAALGSLDGVTVAIKDNLAVAGAPWTAGIEGRRHTIADKDATAVAALRNAGAVILGSANLEEGALGTVTDNPAYGRCFNPLAKGHTPGGSSGGSAAAVAAGMADLALGTDTMGSVRLPSAYCGLYGLKTTHGLVGAGGLVPLAHSLDTIGPLARDVRLLWPATQAIAGPDSRDPENRPAPSCWSERPEHSDFLGLTFAVPRQWQQVPCMAEVEAAFTRILDHLRDLGATVREIDLTGWEPTTDRHAGLLVIEAEAAHALGPLETEGALSPALQSMLRYGRDMPTTKLVAALDRVRAVAASVERAFVDADALILPTTPHLAYPQGNPPPTGQADFMPLANFSGCPAVALPVPVPGSRLPTSVQIIGPHWSEARLTRWAEILAPVLSEP